MTLLAPAGVVRNEAGGGGARMKSSIPAEFVAEEFIASEPERPIAELETIAGAYPNPFVNQTAFRFQLLQCQPVSINVYNFAGNLVSPLLNEQLEAGQHAVNWDGRMQNGNPVPKGMYILRFQQGNAIQSIKIIKK